MNVRSLAVGRLRQGFGALALVLALTLIAAACDRTETSSAPVTSTSPAGTSTAPSGDSAKHREEARLRVAHAGADAGTVDLRVSGTDDTLFGNVEYRAVSKYQDVAPLNGALQILNDAKAVLTSVNLHLEAGRFYTVVIVGSARDATLEAFLIEDSLSP